LSHKAPYFSAEQWVFGVGYISFARPTLVDTVTKSDECEHKIGHNTACNGDNMQAVLSLWGVFGVGRFNCAIEK